MGKIYFICKSLDKLGGIERVVNTLANSLSKNHKVEAISYYKNREKPYFKYNQEIRFSTIIDNINLKSQKYRKKKFLYLLLRAWEKGRNYLRSLYLVRRYAKKITKDDIVVFGRVEMALKFLPYIKRAKKVIVREAIHIYDHHNIKKLKKIFLDKVDLFIVSSDENIKIYNKFFDNRLDIKKIYNPLGIVPTGNVDMNSKVAISVGRYDLQKGFDVLIRSWRIVANEYPDWKLRILGSGHYKDEMENLISELKLDYNIELVADDPNVVAQLEQASIFIMTSRIEGYANALVEAMACGLACVSFDWVMGVSDIIINGKNGIVVPLKDRVKYMDYNYWDNADVENMASAIIRLIKNKKDRTRYGREGIKIISSRKQSVILKKWNSYILK